MRQLIVIFLLLWSVAAPAKSSKDVLVVHSYHQGFSWTDEFQAGLSHDLNGQGITYRALYLDTKRDQTPEYLRQLYRLYHAKLEEEQFEAVVVSDNNALNLMNRLGDLLGDTPVIFSGINGYQPDMHKALRATGVSSNIDLEENLALIQRVQPQAKRVTIISDYSVTGYAVRDQIDRFIQNHTNLSVQIEHMVPESYDELLERVSESDGINTAILFWGYYRDREGKPARLNIWKRVAESAASPVYLTHDSGMGYGAVGGVIQSARGQGETAAHMLREILGNPSAPLPPVRNGTPKTVLDYTAISQWNLTVPLEESVTLLNKPQSLTERYGSTLRLALSLILMMAVIILVLGYYLRRLYASENKAKHNQILLESMLDRSHQFVGILDSFGRVKLSNPRLQELISGKEFEPELPFWRHHALEKEAARRLRHYFESTDMQLVERFELEILSSTHGCMLLDVVLSPLPSEAGKLSQYMFEASDITTRVLTQQKLVEREATLRTYYDQQPVMMLTLDDNNRIQAVNQFAEELLGYNNMALLGHRLRDFYVDETSLPARQLLIQPQQNAKSVWRREIRYRHKDGQSLWIRENVRPIGEDGQLLVVGEDITEIRSLTEQLEYQARYDQLTEAFNRNHFELELEKSLREVEGHMRTHAMLYLDLDQLKVLNDTAGHEAGDAAIKFAAALVEQELPYSATLARMGGDEFAVLLRDCNEIGAQKIATAIIQVLSTSAFTWGNITLNITCSIGIRLIDHTADSPQMVHAQADTACHAAKDEGRNRYHVYHVDDADLRQRQQEMESVSLVHEALANDRLELFAQQILDLNDEDGQPKLHFEILVRIRNPEGEYISPGIFMPASEKYNIAHLIDRAVVTKTLAWLEAHPQAVEQLSFCSINLSGQTIGNRDFVRFLLNAIDESSVPSEKLCIEVTETAAMGNINQAVELFTRIKKKGCLIALDDFGSGLSSFGYLKKLPIDVVKIDGMFVRDMDTNQTDYVMVRSINDLVKQMGKRTVAEFVENTRIISRLTELGIDYAQGYVINRPKPLAELVDEILGTQYHLE
ncbi:ABC transporter substrate binding protein [Vibrio albus]|uniref:ABC transporter substrate binding protein n=1 Tax=Vibrio albus TaxID=2200953 RepID=UPI003CCB77B9